MIKLIDHLAALTGHRDRDALDAVLADAVNHLVRPRAVGVYRAVDDHDSRRWLTRARIHRGRIARPVRVATARLPPLGDFPHRCTALGGTCAVSATAAENVNVFPIAAAQETGGVLEVVTDVPLDSRELESVHGLLRIFENWQALLDYSERDSLTGLLNRKTFDDSFFKVVQAAAPRSPIPTERRLTEASLPHWLAMVDIDFFKSVNDTYGHLIGDEVLLLVARLMRAEMRHHDHLYRFGGEEFVIVLPAHEEDDAAASLERLRERVEAYPFPQVGRLTISIGFTVILGGDSPTSALERADRAVYHAKDHGRNQVCSHARLIAEGRAEEEDKTGAIELF